MTDNIDGRLMSEDYHPHRHREFQRRRPQAWLADVLARIAEMPQNRLPGLLP